MVSGRIPSPDYFGAYSGGHSIAVAIVFMLLDLAHQHPQVGVFRVTAVALYNSSNFIPDPQSDRMFVVCQHINMAEATPLSVLLILLLPHQIMTYLTQEKYYA